MAEAVLSEPAILPKVIYCQRLRNVRGLCGRGPVFGHDVHCQQAVRHQLFTVQPVADVGLHHVVNRLVVGPQVLVDNVLYKSF